MRKTSITLVVIIALMAVPILLIGLPATEAQTARKASWVYGEFVLNGQSATFETQEEFHKLDPPSTYNEGGRSQRTDWGYVHYQTSLKMLHLNRLGADGWELVSTLAIEDGAAYTMRRRQ